ncbi:MAG TPA: hypothetical protein VEL31_18785, partial [Ktedonobacteraceae bacterium]|nr:hypothetical protein [Ktedonobacteraceae bacterium]
MIDSFTEWHLLPMVTPAAILRCVGRIHFDSRSSSFFRFGEQFIKKSRPSRVLNAFSEAMVMNHPVDMQIFHADHAETVYNLATMLMGKVIAPELDTLMHTCHGFTVLASLRRTFCQFGMLALHFGKGLFFLAEKARIGYLF